MTRRLARLSQTDLLVDEEFDEKNSLLLFDPIETWKKTHLAPGTYTTASNFLDSIIQNGECRLRVSKGYGHPRILQERTGDAVG